VLTDFQQTVAIAVSRAVESEGFALAGGAAMIIQGLVERNTRDLDFFSLEASSVNRFAPSIEAALRANGMSVKRRVNAPGFVRLDVTRAKETCEVDLAHDVRLLPSVTTPLGPALASEELAADKTLALFGRAAARDFIDVFSLCQRFGEDRLFELAAQKDPGFDPAHFAEALAAFSRLRREAFEVDEVAYVSIRQWADEWRSRIVAQRLLNGDRDGTER
jgi:hypothetical protein